MKDNINIEELFKQQFEGFESNVSPEVWTNISQSIGSTVATTAVTGGLSTFAKIAIVSGGVIIASVSGALILDPPGDQEGSTTPIEETIIDDNSENNNEITGNFYVPEDEADSAIRNHEEELMEAREENQLRDLVISEELIEQILIDATDLQDGVDFMIFEKIEDASHEDAPRNNDKTITVEGNDQSDSNDESNDLPNEDIEIVKIEDVDETVEPNNVDQLADEDCIGVPNIFTPNGDFTNDVWMVNTVDIQIFVLEIRDSKGEVVFTTTDKEFEWDGTNFFDVRVEAGVYNYVIVAERSNGNKLVTQGSVTVQY